jgi:hypothetical protein
MTTNRRTVVSLAIAAALALGAAPCAWAQQKQRVSFNVPATSTKYIQQHTIDVGDVPGHQVRIFELQRTFGADAPMIEGVRVKELWTRGITDFTELNGLGTSYNVYVMENGDKIYSRGSFLAHAMGEGKLRNISTATVTGGTGKFASIRGSVRGETNADPKAGVNQTRGEMEYWLDK